MNINNAASELLKDLKSKYPNIYGGGILRNGILSSGMDPGRIVIMFKENSAIPTENLPEEYEGHKVVYFNSL